MTSRRLYVKERGHTDVDPTIWTVLSKDKNFHRMLDRGFLSARLLANGLTRLEGSCYVGRVHCGDVEVELQEKVPGALETLLYYATHSAFKVERAKSPTSDLGTLAQLIIRQFLAAVTDYVSGSREFAYERQRKVGSLAGGRIDVAKSIQLRARGLGHLLAFEKNAITFNTPLNRVILAALAEVERLAQLIDVEPRDIERVRGLALLFSDCWDARLLVSDRVSLCQLADDLATSCTTIRHKDVAALAAVILAHESFERHAETGSYVPRAWFLNLEKLFERAIVLELRQRKLPSMSLFTGGERPRPMFERQSGMYTAHPDIVVVSEDGTVVVGDVKYKNWTGGAAPSDIYQLLSHTAAFSGRRSFLVFPNDEFLVVRLGKAVTGPDTWLFALDLNSLPESVALMAGELGIRVCIDSVQHELSRRRVGH